jgi:hypothetical protein
MHHYQTFKQSVMLSRLGGEASLNANAMAWAIFSRLRDASLRSPLGAGRGSMTCKKDGIMPARSIQGCDTRPNSSEGNDIDTIVPHRKR